MGAIGAVSAARAADARSLVVGYRWAGSFAMPVAMTWSICGDKPGTVVDGRGGGSVRWLLIWRSMLLPGYGWAPVRH